MNLEVMLSTSIILVLSIILATLLSQNFLNKGGLSYLFWSIGMWFFSVGVALEVVFSVGVFNEALIDVYTLVVAVLVGFLALGSTSLLSRKMFFLSYVLYFALTASFLMVTLLLTHIGNIISRGVVFGPLPMLVVISSSLVTFPAAALLIIISLLSYAKTKSWKLISIVAGVIVVSIAGTLYIASFPSFLYIAEFIGILLLWFGFVDFRYLFNSREVKERNVVGNVR